MKFLHAADIHLDSPLTGLARRGAIPSYVTQNCTRRAFVNLIDLAIAEDVAFLLIAGDLYDGDWRDFSTGLFFAEQMRRLGRPCIIVRGNHDAVSVITKELLPPPNVHELSSRKLDRWVSDELGVVIHGRSFPDRHIPEDLSETYPGPEPGRFSIAMLHTSGEDPGAHAVYAPCRIEALVAKGYDYWALGHIHDRRAVRPNIVFPGNTQGRHVRETGAKGATLVEVVDRQIVDIRHCATDVLRWAHMPVQLGGVEQFAEAALRIRFAIDEHSTLMQGRPLLARITLSGATILHAGFAADPARLEAECRNLALATGKEIYLERVSLHTHMPQAERGAASAELAEVFAKGLDDGEIVERLLSEFRKLRQDMPFVSGAPPPTLPQTLEDLQALLPDAWACAEQALRGSDAA